jgi:ubiquinone/menaquinone biosynthesis C-methylase UbiE
VGLWSRFFAVAYDPFTSAAERSGLGVARDDLLAGARGRVLEIGAGTGANVAHYPPGADVVYTEPDPAMVRRLRKHGVEVTEAPADQLPFADGSFDTIVSTFVLCTVPDVDRALRELRRVLAPGGSLLFLEHVRAATGTKLERWQDRLHGPWKAFACGCHCNRDLLAAIGTEFAIDGVRHEAWKFMPPVVRPLVIGSAS